MAADSGRSINNGSELKAQAESHNVEYANPPIDTINHDMTLEEEKKMVRKMDLKIFPIVIALYILSFLDRVNIGNARLYRLEEDLGLRGDDYQLCVSVLFVTYFLFEMPANVFLKMVQPRRFIPMTAICWGIVSMRTGFVQNKPQLIALRLLLGLFEAGCFPAICFYLTFFYRRRELAVRIFFLFAASAVSGSTGGLLAYAWRWLMILKGISTVLFGVAAYFVLANDPQSAMYLTDREKEPAVLRFHLDGTYLGMKGESDHIDWEQVVSAFKDWKVWTIAIAQHGITVMLYGFSTFLPTIIHGLGYSGIHTQFLTIPYYACGAITYLCVAYFSDKMGKRGIFAVGGCITSCVGYAILLGTPKHGAGAQYPGCVIVATGLYVAVGIPISWMPNNLPSHFKRAAGQGTSLTFGNCAGIYAAFLYRTQDSPTFKLGHGATLGFVFMAGTFWSIISMLLRAENEKRDRGERDYVLEGKTSEKIARLDDYNPEYRYIY